MNLEEKLYTSTEVAQILGVSLRSVYRYMEEGKLDAEVKTATGRHRFTKQDILNFLYPKGGTPVQPREAVAHSQPHQEQPAYAEAPKQPRYEAPVAEPQEVRHAPVEEAPVDWLAKFREAASKFKTESTQPQPAQVPQQQVYEAPVSDRVSGISDFSIKSDADRYTEDTNKYYYYRSMLGGLKDIAQNIDKSSKRSFVDYAFTMNAGLSLHKPIKPFSILHAYIKDHDRSFFEKVLNLAPSDSKDAQLCLITTSDGTLFSERKEMHGLYVVSDSQLRKDLINAGELSLAAELDH